MLRHASSRILLASPPLQAPPLFRRSPRACLFLLAWLKCPEPSTQTPNPVPSVSPGRSALASSASFASAGSRDAWRPGELRQAGCDRAAQQRASSRPSLIGVISQNMFSKAGIHFLPFTIHLFSCARACTWCVPVCVMSVFVRACTVPRCALYNRISTSTTPPSSSPCLPPPILINSPPPTPPFQPVLKLKPPPVKRCPPGGCWMGKPLLSRSPPLFANCPGPANNTHI